MTRQNKRSTIAGCGRGALPPDVKRCGRCGETKPLSAFHRRGAGHQWCCRQCRKEWDAAYWTRRREFRIERHRARKAELRRWFRELKSSQACVDCGGRFHWAAMTYDHLPGTPKRGEVSNLIARGYRTAIVKELASCELVCANCHAVRTHKRREAMLSSTRPSRIAAEPSKGDQETSSAPTARACAEGGMETPATVAH